MTDQSRKDITLAFFCLAAVLFGGAIIRPEHSWPFIVGGVGIALVGILVVAGQQIGIIKITKKGLEIISPTTTHQISPASPPQLEPLISKEEHQERQENYQLLNRPPAPGMKGRIKPFAVLDDAAAVRAMPGTDPTIPMYRLDRDFRILDWNEAFTLAFDGSLEGRRGQNAQEWVFFLENYEEVMAHGVAAFGDPKKLPRFDFEILRYKSRRYGDLEAAKRAYQVPAPDGSVDSWLCVLDLKFTNPDTALQFQLDLISIIRDDLLWSEYAVCYDRVLTNAAVYRELIDEVLGETGADGSLEPIAPDARVADLGAGTGNVTSRLLKESDLRSVVAIDNNRFMLGALRLKCQKHLKLVRGHPGVLAVKQDITNLYGLPDNEFDVAIMNNVLYAVREPDKCLREVLRVLKPGGEIRLSGPKKDTNLKILFSRIKSDIKGRWHELEGDFHLMESINTLRLSKWLYKWSPDELAKKLEDCGFVGDAHGKIWIKTDAYAGQGMIIRAFKPK